MQDAGQDPMGMSDEELAETRDDLNKRKDYDYSQHGGKPGPNSKWLWERIQAIEAEQAYRSGPVPFRGESIPDISAQAEQAYRSGTVTERIGRDMLDPFKWLIEGLIRIGIKRWVWGLMGAGVLAAVVGLSLAGSSDGIATVNPPDAEPPNPVVGDPVDTPQVGPCEVTTYADFWDTRTGFEFIPLAVPSGGGVTIVVTTDAQGAAVFEQDQANFHARVGGEDFGPGELFVDTQLRFRGQLPAGDPGAVEVELLHGDFVFAGTSGGCLTRTPARVN